MEHTQGRWEKEGNKVRVHGKGVIAVCPSPTDAGGVFEFIANTQRIVECVNACKGITPSGIEGAIKALEELLQGNEVYHSSKETGYRVAPSPDAVAKGIEALANVKGGK